MKFKTPMAFHGAHFNGESFPKKELQTAAALHIYCKYADGSYADADLIGEIILDMRNLAGPTLRCQGIGTYLRDSGNKLHRQAWDEVIENDIVWRGEAEQAYWTWRNRKAELCSR